MFVFAIGLFLLGSAAAAANEGYVDVEGKCVDVKPQPDYKKELIEQPWLVVKASQTEDGDSCMAVTLTEGNDNQVSVNITLYNSKTMKFSNVITKYTHRGDGTYIGTDGETMEGRENSVPQCRKNSDTAMYTDYKNYLVCIKCRTVDGKAQIMATYSTRSGKIDKDAQIMFQEAEKELKKMKLAVPMKDIPQEDCKTQ